MYLGARAARLLLALFSALFGCSQIAAATEQNGLPIDASGHVNRNNPTQLGNGNLLHVSAGVKETYLRFDASTLNPGSTIISATLRLKVYTGAATCTATGVANDSWEETTLNWSNAPGLGAEIASAVCFGGSWMELDVSDYVANEVAGDRMVSIGLKAIGDDGITVKFYSEQHGTSANHPELLITYSDSPPPSEVCGDGVCSGTEDCASCASDCGVCEVCGDGVCSASEDCASCASDCGACGLAAVATLGPGGGGSLAGLAFSQDGTQIMAGVDCGGVREADLNATPFAFEVPRLPLGTLDGDSIRAVGRMADPSTGVELQFVGTKDGRVYRRDAAARGNWELMLSFSNRVDISSIYADPRADHFGTLYVGFGSTDMRHNSASSQHPLPGDGQRYGHIVIVTSADAYTRSEPVDNWDEGDFTTDDPNLSLNILGGEYGDAASVLSLLIVLPTTGLSHAYVATDRGVFRATSTQGFSDQDADVDFAPYNAGVQTHHRNTRDFVTYADTQGTQILVSVDRNFDTDSGGTVYRKALGNDTWVDMSSWFAEYDSKRRIWDLARHPQNPTRVFACNGKFNGALYQLVEDGGGMRWEPYFDQTQIAGMNMPYSETHATFSCLFVDVSDMQLLAGGANRGGLWLIDRFDPTQFELLSSQAQGNGFRSRGASDFTVVYDVGFASDGELFVAVADWVGVQGYAASEAWRTRVASGKSRSVVIDSRDWVYTVLKGNFRGTTASVQLSTDRGSTWQLIASSTAGESNIRITDATQVAILGDQLFAIVRTSQGWRLARKPIGTLSRSEDPYNWSELMTNGLPSSGKLESLATSAQANLVWVAGEAGLYVSSDGGVSFNRYTAGSNPPVTVSDHVELVMADASAEVFYVVHNAPSNDRVYRTVWDASSANRPVPELVTDDFRYVTSLHKRGEALYIADRRQGLAKVDLRVTPYQARIYADSDNPLPTNDLYYVTSSPVDGALIVGTHCYGLWRVGTHF